MGRVIVRQRRAGGGGWMLFSGVLVIVLGLLAAACWSAWRDARDSAAWSATSCTILESRTFVSSGKGAEFRLEVRYGYRTGDQSHVSDRWSFFGRHLSLLYTRRHLYHLEGKFAAGAVVPCFVDPADPSQAVLDRGVPHRFQNFVLTLAGLALAGTGLFAYGAVLSARVRAAKRTTR